jgi:hypothetical protein
VGRPRHLFAGGRPGRRNRLARTTAPTVEQALTAVDTAGDRLTGRMAQVNSASPAVLVRHLTALHEATGAGSCCMTTLRKDQQERHSGPAE